MSHAASCRCCRCAAQTGQHAAQVGNTGGPSTAPKCASAPEGEPPNTTPQAQRPPTRHEVTQPRCVAITVPLARLASAAGRAIDKHGSAGLRFWCQETVWRLFKFQPNYRGVLWARARMRAANKSRAKQIAVALARRFVIDWWRVRTGQATCAELGLVFKNPAATA